MIERTATLKTLEGDVIPLPMDEKDKRQIIKLTISYKWVDNKTGNDERYGGSDLISVHVKRDCLDAIDFFKAGPPQEPKTIRPATVDELAVQLLQALGVKFEE